MRSKLEFAPYIYLNGTYHSPPYHLFIAVPIDDANDISTEMNTPSYYTDAAGDSWLVISFNKSNLGTAPVEYGVSFRYVAIDQTLISNTVGVITQIKNETGDDVIHFTWINYEKVDPYRLPSIPLSAKVTNLPYLHLSASNNEDKFMPCLLVLLENTEIISENVIIEYPNENCSVEIKLQFNPNVLETFYEPPLSNSIIYNDIDESGELSIDIDIISLNEGSRKTVIKNKHADEIFIGSQ